MSPSATHTISHKAVVNAPAQLAFDVIADVDGWAQYFGPGVHAELLEGEDGEQLIRRWALTGGPESTDVRVWTSRRRLDREALRLTFEEVEPQAPVRHMRAVWSFDARGPESTAVELRHEFGVVDDDSEQVERISADLRAKGGAQLESLRDTVENWEDLQERVISFEDPLFIGGSLEDVYEFLYAADKWPERVPHVSKLEMTEEVPGIQFFDMHTQTPDGREHTTRSVRVCLPGRKIVYKQIGLPALLDAHTGHWEFRQTPEGVIAIARHTATIKPSALHILGEGTTVRDARKYLRRVLSTNSLQTLRHAQQFAEERQAVRA